MSTDSITVTIPSGESVTYFISRENDDHNIGNETLSGIVKALKQGLVEAPANRQPSTEN